MPYNRNGSHRFRALTADHDVVHQTDHVGDAVLDHHRHRQHQRPLVDRIVFSHKVSSSCDVKSNCFLIIAKVKAGF